MAASIPIGLVEAHLPGEQTVILWPECRMRFEKTTAGRQNQASLAAVAVPALVLGVVS